MDNLKRIIIEAADRDRIIKGKSESEPIVSFNLHHYICELTEINKTLTFLKEQKMSIRDSKFYKSLDSFKATSYAEGFCEGEGASEDEQLAAW